MNADQLWNEVSRLNNELTTAQRELVKTNARLAWMNEQKNQLLGMAAHDLRSPLSMMLTYVDYLAATAGLDGEQQRILARIRANASYMLEMVDDALDLSAIETGNVTLHLEETDLDALLIEIEETARGMAARKGLVLERLAAQSPAIVRADRTKVLQSVQNLVSNALKFSPSGTRVELASGTDDDVAWIAVRDEGPGIAESELGKLFEPFSRLSARATGGEKSSGLGLAIVRRLIEAHGGAVRVTSEVGRGTEFRISLPLRR
jgi:signal transduction histidine kinase